MRNLPRYSFFDRQAPGNVGDCLGPQLLEHMLGPGTTTRNPDQTPKLLSIGSVLGHTYRHGDYVWGSGIIDSDHRVSISHLDRVLALRGPLTHARLYPTPRRPIPYGDPAILAPLYWESPSRPRRYLGILPHWVDAVHNPYPATTTFTMTIEWPLEPLIRNLAECHTVITTSLHGLILAEVFQVPTVIWEDSWSGKVVGGRFKFFDYLAATGRHMERPGLVPQLPTDTLLAQQGNLIAALESAL